MFMFITTDDDNGNDPLMKYSAEELYAEAETVEEYGEYLHIDLMGYSAEHLRAVAKLKEACLYIGISM